MDYIWFGDFPSADISYLILLRTGTLCSESFPFINI